VAALRSAEIRTAHTASLSAADLRAVRELLDEAFGGDFSDEDYEHGLGGMHALVWDAATLIAHGSVIMRRLLHSGRTLRTGYVESVAVHPDHRRQGHGNAVMTTLEAIISGGYEIGALSSSEDGLAFYASRGWRLWRGTASVLSPGGIVRSPEDDGAIFVLPGSAQLQSDGDLACDWREGDPW